MTYKAIALNPENPLQFIVLHKPIPYPRGYDLLVEVKAVSVNPIDTKIRQNAKKNGLHKPRVLGWDASGIVLSIGSLVRNFKPGDTVFYAGDITRPGSNATHQLVDSRITGYKPKKLNWAQAAALPLTALTAWEGLFDRLHLNNNDVNKKLLIIGGAGGVGSLAIPFAKLCSTVEVIATASREKSIQWCINRGANIVINHTKMPESLTRYHIDQIDYIFCLNNIDEHWPDMCKLISPQGKICTIVENDAPLSFEEIKRKSVSLHFEFMYTRSLFHTPDLSRQGKILNHISQMIDQGKITTSLKKELYGLNIDTLSKAHELVLEGHMCGKAVIVY
ncbi:Zinc-binding alcohol dehydrogenase family protein [Candidatus Erwinia haradaeae]|uniref:Zinc-type alcohol dehydrogenase-like protein n=1 Tax=Candidatus Erwinia haradaeae TaxID=1922217 RepID=A0A451DC24_9GAMM|nr:zinc-binding alcohol dehydrogenase family protein [Candidatus Erwinia haradaeae]VFP83928.1 Zinc-binding alcohol dehydrogenase family protein [Candidatus Erwinia haradaeae]